MPETKTITRLCLLFPIAALASAMPVAWAEEPLAPAAPAVMPYQPAAPVAPPEPGFLERAPAAPGSGSRLDDGEPETIETDRSAPSVSDAPSTKPNELPAASPDAPEPATEEFGAEQYPHGGAIAEDTEKPSENVPLDDLRIFAEVFGRIKSDYVEQVDDRKLLASAIKGMLGGLDPHSAYLDPEEYRELQVGTTGEFGGLGIEVGMEDGFVKVIAPIDDTPAQRAGMEAGDLIVRIDGKPIKGLGLNDAVKLMRGKPGTSIELTVVREGEGSPLTMTIERDVIKVASVKSRTLEPGYGYLRVASFQARTTDDLLKAVAELKGENKDGLQGVVLDLRNNPGGVLNAAVGVSDAFLDQGLIVYTKGRIDDSKLEFRAGPDDILDGAPMIVLVNGGSASASEIVAGALQDQSRAIVMGGKTFGKGSVQTIVPINERTALKLTTARYYTPLGRSIQAHGIEPDIELERGSVTLADESGIEPLKEADLMRHLDDGTDKTSPGADLDADDASLAAEDYQLSEALNVLKGLSLYAKAAKTR
ncbi:MAG: S41 family peptidase [Thiohalocapsa sp.]